MDYNYLPLDSIPLRLEQLKMLLHYKQHISITFQAWEAVETGRKYLSEKLAANQKPYYGINTGFGYLQDRKIAPAQIEQLQYNLLMSHACGMGDFVPVEIAKLMLALKVKSLSYGHSGVQNTTIQRLMDLHNQDVIPVIYTQGSLGASGDLAPLSHMSLPIIGLGEVWYKGERTATKTVEKALGWQPVTLKSKEGLALINGTQFMLAYGTWCMLKAKKLMEMADRIAALSFDAFDCNPEPLHEAVHRVRPHKGQTQSAANLRHWLSGSAIAEKSEKELQDPYSFRCIPQVHGASRDALAHIESVFITEVNSVTDNPNIFPEEDLILNGGNFHGQPLALALDYMKIAVSELANISERRTYQLISGQRNLPLFLTPDAGLNSGFMIPQYTAASIVSENKQLCTPASVDSISSSNNQEDHVSMGANAATQCYRVVNNLEKVLAIELLSACQALDFRRPLQTSPKLEKLFAQFREVVSFNEQDRVLQPDLEKAVNFLASISI